MVGQGCLDGKCILIMVVGQGIGCVIVLVCVVEGVQVIVMDFCVELLDGLDGMCIEFLDVIDVDVIVWFVVDLGDLDGIFNCVGVVYGGIVFDIDDVDWVFVFDLNVMVMMWMICVFLFGMFSCVQQLGLVFIVNMVLMVSLFKGFLNCMIYGVSKVVVIGLIKGVVVDFVKQGVCCNVFCFGMVDMFSLCGCIVLVVDFVQVEKDFIVC